MTQRPDEVKLTAYALGELDASERAAVEARLAADPAARREVEEIVRIAGLLRRELAGEGAPQLAALERSFLEAEARRLAAGRPPVPSVWLRAGALAAAAAVAIGAGAVAWHVLWGGPGPRRPGERPVVIRPSVEPNRWVPELPIVGTPRNWPPLAGWGAVEAVAASDAPADAFAPGGERRFLRAAERPIAPVPALAGGSGFAEVQAALVDEGRWPETDTVRLEELINSVPYQYAGPAEEGEHLLAIHADVTACPWDRRHRLLRVAVKARGHSPRFDVLPEAREVFAAEAGSTLAGIARDVVIEVTFDAAAVESYRLIGYERRLGTRDDAPGGADEGVIGPGYAVTALFEMAPVASGSGQVGTVSVRYRPAENGHVRTVEQRVRDAGESFEGAPADLRFAAAVAAFGLVLRDSPYKGQATLDGALEIARGALGDDPLGYRAELVRLIDAATTLRRTP